MHMTALVTCQFNVLEHDQYFKGTEFCKKFRKIVIETSEALHLAHHFKAAQSASTLTEGDYFGED
jgi:hypothetical protein